MSFVSIEYLFLLTAVFLLATAVRGRAVTYLALTASIFFYAWGNVAYLLLLGSITLITYGGGKILEKSRSLRQLWLFTLLALAPLFYFKYLGLLTSYVNATADYLGQNIDLRVTTTFLPVGISFLTFQGIGYLVDVYRGSVSAERSFLRTALFLSYFPQLVAGPIERASHLLPQLRRLEEDWQVVADLKRGVFLILKGVIFKLVLADNFGIFVDEVYTNPASQPAGNVVLAAYFFSFQIYCDFLGYTLIALGSASLFGVDLINNFEHPYHAASIQDFWRRWHISLSRWFRDYVYIPLGGNRVVFPRFALNLVLTMLLVGLWHGATIPYLIWAFLHAGMLVIHRVYKAMLRPFVPERSGRAAQALSWFFGLLFTFHFVTLAWIPFRAPDYRTIVIIFKKIFEAVCALPVFDVQHDLIDFFLRIAVIFLMVEVLDSVLDLEGVWKRSPTALQAVFVVIVLLLTYLGPVNDVQFIYFQF